MLARCLVTALLAAGTVGLLAAPAAASCGGVGLPGKEPVIVFHC